MSPTKVKPQRGCRGPYAFLSPIEIGLLLRLDAVQHDPEYLTIKQKLAATTTPMSRLMREPHA